MGLAAGAHVVCSGHDVKVHGVLDAVSGGQDVGVGDEGTAAEPGVVDEEGDNPGPLVLGRLHAAYDPVGGGRALNTALISKVLDGVLEELAALQLIGSPGSGKSS